MMPIAHIMTFCYIVDLIAGTGCLCVIFSLKEKISKLFGLEYDMLKKFLLFFFLFLLANFLIYYNEVFMSYHLFKIIMLSVFDLLLVATVYCAIKLNVLSSMGLVLKLFLVTGSLYVILWAVAYIFEFSHNPVAYSILVLIADALFSAVTSGILIVCTTHQLQHNEELWERRYLIAINIMLIAYVCVLYCYNLYTQLSRAYVSHDTGYPYFAEPVLLVFLAVNGFTMVFLAIGMRHIKATEKEQENLPEPKEIEEAAPSFYEANHISAREREVIELVMQGRNNAEIAEELSISVYTVKRHVNNIFRKLKVKSRFELLCKVKQ